MKWGHKAPFYIIYARARVYFFVHFLRAKKIMLL